jgi:pyruvate dehydrogenase E2 component (dihydrolipoamide acetyltransferase)
MRVPLILPQLGLTQTEGYVSEWLKKPGDHISKEEIVFVVSTDKAEMEVESPADGILGEIVVDVGVTVPVGTPLAWLELQGPVQPASSLTFAEPSPEPAASAGEPNDANVAPSLDHASDRARLNFLVSPRARRVARSLGVDLHNLKGTGPNGRILEADVRAADSMEEKAPIAANPDPRLASSRRRQIIAERMTESIRTIPTFTVSVEVNAARLVELYKDIRERFTGGPGLKLSYTDLLTKCLAMTLERTPELNAAWTDAGPVPKSSIELNLAVATDAGVVAPLLRSLANAALQNIVESRAEITRKAREGRLSINDLESGTGTLSNLGMYRVDSFAGIITPGQSFLLSVGKLARRPWAETDHLTIKPTLHLTLAVDHRVADGAQAAIFLGRIAELIETPFTLLWETR